MANTTQSIFTIYDAKSETHDKPFFDHNKDTAMRQLADLVNDAQRKMIYYKYPEDFSLFYWGEFDGMSAPHWNMLEAATHICNALSLKEQSSSPHPGFPMTNSPINDEQSANNALRLATEGNDK